jgi:hypothetical protein
MAMDELALLTLELEALLLTELLTDELDALDELPTLLAACELLAAEVALLEEDAGALVPPPSPPPPQASSAAHKATAREPPKPDRIKPRITYTPISILKKLTDHTLSHLAERTNPAKGDHLLQKEKTSPKA